MNKFIIVFLLVGYVFAAPLCATSDELENGGADTAYYLRFLHKEDFNKLGENAFGSSASETGEYIGYQETTDDSAKLKSEHKKASKFTVSKNQNGEGFNLYSTDKKLPKDVVMNQVHVQARILSWNRGKVHKGYFMYVYNSNSIINGIDTDYYRTLFVYDDATNSLSAKPDNKKDSKYVLGIYHESTGTEIYREKNGGAKETKFCFQKVDTILKCPVKDIIKDINIEVLLAEFTSTACDKTDSVEENTVCTVKCADPYVAEGPKTTDYTCQRDGTWNSENNIKCNIAPPCATFSELRKADEATDYYLRFLSEQDFNKDKKNVFKTSDIKSGKYIGYQETSKSFALLKIVTETGETSKFNIQMDEDFQGFRVYSKQKNNEKRILSWSQSKTHPSSGYFMYKINGSMDKSDKHTRFHYDVTYTFSARPDDTNNEYPLGVYYKTSDTAIYRKTDLATGAPNVRFCFEKVDMPSKCPVQDINVKGLNAEFTTNECETSSVEEHKVCTVKCADPYVANGAKTVDYTCQHDGTWDYEQDIKCETKANNKEKKTQNIILAKEKGKWFEAYRELNTQQRQLAKDAIAEKLPNVDFDQIKTETIAEAIKTFFYDKMRHQIQTFLEKSEDNVEPEIQIKIQNYIADTLISDNKTWFQITEDDVAAALADFAKVQNQKRSNVVQFGVLGAVMCLLAVS